MSNKPIRVVVAGGQLFTDEKYFGVALTKALERFIVNNRSIVLMVADKMGGNVMTNAYAQIFNFTVVTKKPQYNVMGRMALPQCYAAMAAEADCVVAFWDGVDRHVASLIGRCVRTRKPYRIFDVTKMVNAAEEPVASPAS